MHILFFISQSFRGRGWVKFVYFFLKAVKRKTVPQKSRRVKNKGLRNDSRKPLGLSGGRIGAIIIGGLNPIAILEEREHRVFSRALSGLLEYDRLFPFEEFPLRLQKYL